MGVGDNKQKAAAERDARLKQALKANLQRRKAQARARATTSKDDRGEEAERDG